MRSLASSICVLAISVGAAIFGPGAELAGGADVVPGGTDVVLTVPRTMAYQGVLRDADGERVPVSFFDVTFRIFSHESGGTEIWSQAASETTDAEGCFTATLINLNLPFDQDYWLEMEIDGQVLSPRQKLAMAPYAAASDTAEFATNAIFSDTAEYARDAGIPSSGWVDMGSYVILQNPSANVSLGVDEPDEKLYIDGGLHVAANALFNNGLNVEGTLIAGKAGVGQDNNTAGSNTFAAGNNNNANGSSSFAAGTYNESGGGNSAVCGGSFNMALGGYSAILGGVENSIYQYCGTIVGGEINRSDGFLSTVISGRYNRAMSNFSLICGGHDDTTRGDYSTIIGGINCVISDPGDYSVLFGIDGYLDQDSTFMVDMPHIRFGDNSTGYEFPVYDGNPGQLISTNGTGQLDWADPAQSGGLRGNGTPNFLPRYSIADSLANSQIFDDGSNVGIGTTSPNSKLTVAGHIRAWGNLVLDGSADVAGAIIANQIDINQFRLGVGGLSGHVLTSDAMGNGTWQALNAISGNGSQNYMPKFAGADSLTNSIVIDNGSRIDVWGEIWGRSHLTIDGSASIADQVATSSIDIGQFRMIPGAISGHVLTSDATGNGTWQPLPAGASAETINRLQSKIDEMVAIIDAQNEKISHLESRVSELANGK
jgi:hypothetical protein